MHGIASNYGIEAARQHLGHRDIRSASSHYVDKKKRIEVRLTQRMLIAFQTHRNAKIRVSILTLRQLIM
jgi:hypothetical protein